MIVCEVVFVEDDANMGLLKPKFIFASLVALALLFPKIAFAQDQEVYCMDFYDEYRNINYWAKKVIFARDYQYNSGDANYLNVTHDVPDKFMDEIDTELVTHFDQEFQNLLQGSIPFHDAEQGHDERWNQAIREYGVSDNLFEMFEAQEEARRNALYGPNPGAAYCHIRIERRDFPVLYEMECTVVANAQLRNRGGINEQKLGYSTPEHIIGELKNSVSEQLQSLGRRLEVIQNCS